MAKYKFTKTIRPTEGICIDADGIVYKLYGLTDDEIAVVEKAVKK